MFDISDWLKQQNIYEQQVQCLSDNIVLVRHIESGVLYKLKLAVEAAAKYLATQEVLWLRRSSDCQPVKCYLSEGNANYQLVVMDYLAGLSLSELLKKRLTMDATRVMSSLFDGINRLHEQGIVHNDIKPNNIIVQNDQAFIIDLASSGWVNQQYSSKKYKSFTPAFSLPDIYLFDSFQPIADWYAYLLILGLVKNGTVYSLTPLNLDDFIHYHEALIYAYEFSPQKQTFLINQLNAISPI